MTVRPQEIDAPLGGRLENAEVGGFTIVLCRIASFIEWRGRS